MRFFLIAVFLVLLPIQANTTKAEVEAFLDKLSKLANAKDINGLSELYAQNYREETVETNDRGEVKLLSTRKNNAIQHLKKAFKVIDTHEYSHEIQHIELLTGSIVAIVTLDITQTVSKAEKEPQTFQNEQVYFLVREEDSLRVLKVVTQKPLSVES